ncbi:MAG: 3-methyladenine glycosylase [Bradyrhizobium sp.]|nr:3-methyladenine glycosylase [Bradyrhizobium sp.]
MGPASTNDARTRCAWAVPGKPLVIRYHDHEWGVPARDDRKHFEFLVLEGAQTGLNWLVILNKREGYRRAFSDFDPAKVARYSDKRVAKLLQNPDIIRNRMKIESAISNVRAFLKVQEEFGTFWAYAWQFIGGRPKQNRWKNVDDIPATTPVSDAFSKDLKGRGFSFVGSTVVYAHMQATGMVNDHAVDCFRYSEILRNDTLAT